MRKRIIALCLGVSLVCTLFAGCGKATEEPTKQDEVIESVDNSNATTTETQVVETEVEEKEVFPEGMGRSYLTGELVPAEQANKRPVGIMIPEDKVAQPQYGISLADVVYEFEAEGSISRQLMFYSDYSGLEKWGNIRSAREYFICTAIAWDAIYIHFGGALGAYEQYFNNPDVSIDDIDFYEGPFGSYFYRSNDKKAPHNAYTSTELIDSCIEKFGYRTTVADDFNGYFKFNKDAENEIVLENGMDANAVSGYFRYSKPYYVYNEELGVYERYIHDTKQVDAYNNESMKFKNVILQYTEVKSYMDEQNHDRTDIDIVGTGNGLYATNGKAIDITWKCDAEGAVTHFYDMDGNEILLNQGKTMVAVIDLDDVKSSGAFASLEELKASR